MLMTQGEDAVFALPLGRGSAGGGRGAARALLGTVAERADPGAGRACVTPGRLCQRAHV